MTVLAVLALSAAALLSVWSVACGTARSGPSIGSHGASGVAPATAASGGKGAELPQVERTSDADIDSDAYEGELDNENEAFGVLASPADARLIAVLLRRYYAVAAAGDGAGACRLLYRVFAETVPEDYGSTSGRFALRATCPAVVSRIFMASRERLSAEYRRLRAISVRVRLNKAAVRFSWGAGNPSHYMMVHRERGVWKIAMLYGSEQPIRME